MCRDINVVVAIVCVSNRAFLMIALQFAASFNGNLLPFQKLSSMLHVCFCLSLPSLGSFSLFVIFFSAPLTFSFSFFSLGFSFLPFFLLFLRFLSFFLLSLFFLQLPPAFFFSVIPSFLASSSVSPPSLASVLLFLPFFSYLFSLVVPVDVISQDLLTSDHIAFEFLPLIVRIFRCMST